MDMDREICAECGKSVKPGSGRFVNRILILDTDKEKKASGRPYWWADYICPECYAKGGIDE